MEIQDHIHTDCPVPHCVVPEQAAEAAVKRAFEVLGVDINNPQQLEEFRKNLWFGGMVRKSFEKGMIATISAFILAVILAGLYSIFKQ